MRPKIWTHDRVSFFKYASRSTAKKIIGNRMLRWSAPKLFNDPFDIQFDLHIEIDVERVKRETLEQLWIAHYGENPPAPGNVLGASIALLRGVFPKLSREEFDAEFGAAFEESVARILAILPEVQRDHRRLLADSKVLCLSELHDNLLMWAHYSEQHTGVVLEFRCVEELDSMFGVAKPVVYSDKMPRMFDDDFLIRMGSGQASIDVPRIVEASQYTKAADWAYEKEWRLVAGRTGAEQDFEDIPFDQAELAAVYLGCRMPDTDRVEILGLIVSKYPHARIFQARKDDKEFKLIFSEIARLDAKR